MIFSLFDNCTDKVDVKLVLCKTRTKVLLSTKYTNMLENKLIKGRQPVNPSSFTE